MQASLIVKKLPTDGAIIAQRIHPRLPSCGPGFEYQANHLGFYIVKFCCTSVIVLRKGRK